jgi:ABC-type bacteriocin/lantibiotic exporter with double-glycine peptidase domain
LESRPDRCGALALAACLATLKVDCTVGEIDLLCGKKGAETSLLDCASAAKQLQLETASYRWDRIPQSINLRETPAILPVVLTGHSHFAAAVDSRPHQFLIIDYPYPPSWVDCAALRRDWKWDGTMLHVAPNGAALQRLRSVAGGRESWLLRVSGVALLIAGTMLFIVSRKRARTRSAS